MNRRPSDKSLGSLGTWLHATGGLCTLALVLLAWLCFFRPLDVAARTARDRAARLQKVIADSRQIRNEHGRLKAQLASAQDSATRLRDSVPDQPQEAEFLAQITQLADEAELEIHDYRPKEKRDRKLYFVLTVDLIAAGPYASVGRFLARLPDLPRHCAVEQLHISSDSQAPECEARMTLRLYYGARGRGVTADETKGKG
jgi:Tfp pilus assembly protein PilO